MEMIHIRALICCVEVLEFLAIGDCVLYPSQVAIMAEERRACREQEYKDQFGNCIACRQCDAGQELSKVCHVALVLVLYHDTEITQCYLLKLFICLLKKFQITFGLDNHRLCFTNSK